MESVQSWLKPQAQFHLSPNSPAVHFLSFSSFNGYFPGLRCSMGWLKAAPHLYNFLSTRDYWVPREISCNQSSAWGHTWYLRGSLSKWMPIQIVCKGLQTGKNSAYTIGKYLFYHVCLNLLSFCISEWNFVIKF